MRNFPAAKKRGYSSWGVHMHPVHPRASSLTLANVFCIFLKANCHSKESTWPCLWRQCLYHRFLKTVNLTAMRCFVSWKNVYR